MIVEIDRDEVHDFRDVGYFYLLANKSIDEVYLGKIKVEVVDAGLLDDTIIMAEDTNVVLVFNTVFENLYFIFLAR